ncbi:hypothetical protein LCGC14_1098760 [marine sediment metagenome]|uniref:Mth938-like domain-containing protein n=1 Tax=marine sediment metagenome TaxID=412755 RepID=A0A0F9MA84_9ZZZZ|nr:hypothetical protein [Methylophaga sp.]
MKFSLETISDANVVHSYDELSIVVRSKEYVELQRLDSSLILMPHQIISDWHIKDITQLEISDVLELKKLDPEVLILAHGSSVYSLPPQLMIEFYAQAIGIECMPLGAACRTYNLLVAEDRNVLLAVILK